MEKSYYILSGYPLVYTRFPISPVFTSFTLVYFADDFKGNLRT